MDQPERPEVGPVPPFGKTFSPDTATPLLLLN
jgi:hypothetical protein